MSKDLKDAADCARRIGMETEIPLESVSEDDDDAVAQTSSIVGPPFVDPKADDHKAKDEKETKDAGASEGDSAIARISTPTSSGACACSVCLNEVFDPASATTLPCGHRFHTSCIATWLTHRSTCPQCRNDIYAVQSSSPTSSLPFAALTGTGTAHPVIVRCVQELAKLMIEPFVPRTNARMNGSTNDSEREERQGDNFASSSTSAANLGNGVTATEWMLFASGWIALLLVVIFVADRISGSRVL